MKSKHQSVGLHASLIRVGAMAEVRRIATPTRLPHGTCVIVRTAWGVQHGEIVTTETDARELPSTSGVPEAEFLRQASEQDNLLVRRLGKDLPNAVEAARKTLKSLGSESMLLDVDPLFDGQTLVFHFLGEIDLAAQSATEALVESFESVTGLRKVARLLSDGCGPGCGTENASGKESGGCSGSCAGCPAAC